MFNGKKIVETKNIHFYHIHKQTSKQVRFDDNDLFGFMKKKTVKNLTGNNAFQSQTNIIANMSVLVMMCQINK